MKQRALHSCLAVIFLLTACQSGGPPAPVEYKGAQQPERPAQNFSGATAVTAQRGDTIYGIARQYNVSVRALIEANNLQPPYQLRAGQVITLPTAREHVVQKGETVYAIARRYNADPQAVIRTNGLKSPYHITVGQRLKLPAPGIQQNDDGAVETAQPSPVTGAPSQTAQVQAPAQTQTQAATSSESGQGPRTIIIASPNAPGGARPAAEPAHPVAEQQNNARPASDTGSRPASDQVAAQDKPPQPAEESGAAAEETRPVQQASAVSRPSVPTTVPAPPQMMGKGFIWPLRGQVIAEFGPLAKGQHNDGINIAVPEGTPVHAAQNGVVAYAGNELRGFGNLLLIKHADGWMTAYAHNDKLLVQRGDKVKRGQTIAMSGSTGAVKSPQLHFELRQGTRAIDPMQHLTEMQAAGAGGSS